MRTNFNNDIFFLIDINHLEISSDQRATYEFATKCCFPRVPLETKHTGGGSGGGGGGGGDLSGCFDTKESVRGESFQEGWLQKGKLYTKRVQTFYFTKTQLEEKNYQKNIWTQEYTINESDPYTSGTEKPIGTAYSKLEFSNIFETSKLFTNTKPHPYSGSLAYYELYTGADWGELSPVFGWNYTGELLFKEEGDLYGPLLAYEDRYTTLFSYQEASSIISYKNHLYAPWWCDTGGENSVKTWEVPIQEGIGVIGKLPPKPYFPHDIVWETFVYEIDPNTDITLEPEEYNPAFDSIYKWPQLQISGDCYDDGEWFGGGDAECQDRYASGEE